MQTVKLTSRREVAPAVYELLFTRPEGWTFEAGQFARIGLAADGDEPVFRAYSIAGSPKAEGLRFLVKSVEGGALSPRLCALNPGDEVLLDGEAQGNLLPARIPGGDTVWMLATGSGLAPFIAMTGDEGTLGAWKKHILVIGARTREEVDRLSALCLIAFSTAVCAAPSAPNDAPPPYAGDVKVEKPAPQSGPAARKPSAEEANPLLPSKADMEKAREERAHGHLPPKFDRQTKIEEVRDENNRVTEYVVTPGTTQIPYRIENRAERPIDSSPAGNSKSTLGTTKFIELGW